MLELTEQEKITLEIFTADEGAFSLVYKLVKDKISQNKDVFIRTLSVKDTSNEEIGAKIRAFDEGNLLVDSIFRELGQFKKKPEQTHINPAR